jgi:hypothetical protein
VVILFFSAMVWLDGWLAGLVGEQASQLTNPSLPISYQDKRRPVVRVIQV